MIIGVPKEVKDHEYRVGIVPAGVRVLVDAGHRVLVESGAGTGSGITDDEYRAAGAEMLPSAAAVYGAADLIMKVKEPVTPEWDLLRPGQVVYAYLHLAPAPELTAALLAKRITGIAYETIRLADGSLPLLTPMSEVAGRLSVQAGARCLQKDAGGRGVLLGGVPGVVPGRVMIIGGGTVGSNAARIAAGMGAEVTVLDVNLPRLRWLDDVYGGRVRTLVSNWHTVAETAREADLVIGAVLVPGARAPRLMTRDMVREMQPGSVIVDVAIDQGGCVETARPTTHSQPTYVEEGVVHYCVTNMPGAVARTSTYALTNVTLPYALALANLGVEEAVRRDRSLAEGLNVYDGVVTHPAVAADLGYRHVPVEEVLH